MLRYKRRKVCILLLACLSVIIVSSTFWITFETEVTENIDFFQMLVVGNQSKETEAAYTMFFKNAGINFRMSGFCPTSGIITIGDRGRLGNQMSQYASLYAYARRDNFIPVITPKMKNFLSSYFSNISLITYDDFRFSCRFTCYQISLEYYEYRKIFRGNFRLWRNPHNILLFNQYKNEIMPQLVFNQSLLNTAKNRIIETVGSLSNATLVGVHVRRTDYKEWLEMKRNGKLVGTDYIRRAMEIYKERFQNIAFLMISDDMEWCKKNFEEDRNVFFIGNNDEESPIIDLATFSVCRHAIITQGTFGFWAAYLTGGSVISPGNYSEKPHGLLKDIRAANLKDWTIIEAFTPRS